jgi:GTP-binding protein EngB required for normal cell division
MNANEFSSQEIEEAKKNGFLLGGKTGAGKSTLINALFGKEMTLVKRSAKAVTQIPNLYFYKLENGKCISIIDSPGLSDPKKLTNKDTDNIHLDKIVKLVEKEKVNIKGILFLVNFQGERFDSDEATALINYNKIFPLRTFWQHVLIIFTHHYSDPYGDSLEEMKSEKDSSNKEIFGDIMNSVNQVSDVIDYNDLKTQYFNSYWPIKEDRRIEQTTSNNQNRKNLEVLLNDFSQKEPLFSKIEIVTQKGQIFQKDDKYFSADVTLIGYFDLNGKKPIKEEKLLTNYKEVKNPPLIQKPNYSITVNRGGLNRNGKVEIEHVPATNENSYYHNKFKDIGIGGAIGAGVGAAIGGIIVCTNPGCLAALLAYGTGVVVGGGAAGGGVIGGFGGWIKSLFNK